jgi:hypothetical protein
MLTPSRHGAARLGENAGDIGEPLLSLGFEIVLPNERSLFVSGDLAGDEDQSVGADRWGPLVYA